MSAGVGDTGVTSLLVVFDFRPQSNSPAIISWIATGFLRVALLGLRAMISFAVVGLLSAGG
jgi:hypothetical protein